MSFENVKVIVTGGARGIGKACVKAFANKGATVIILDIDQTGKKLSGDIDGNTYFLQCDVSKENDVRTVFRKIEKKISTVEILVNNAGIQRYSTVTETSEEEWDLVPGCQFEDACY